MYEKGKKIKKINDNFNNNDEEDEKNNDTNFNLRKVKTVRERNIININETGLVNHILEGLKGEFTKNLKIKLKLPLLMKKFIFIFLFSYNLYN